MIQDRVYKITSENRKLHEVIAIKEAETLSIIDIVETSNKVESNNKTLHKKVQELEEEIIAKLSKSTLEQIKEIK